jgi:hypothetical protein
MSKLTLAKLWDWPIDRSHLSAEIKRKIRHQVEPIAALCGVLIGLVVWRAAGSLVAIVLSSVLGACAGYYIARYIFVRMHAHAKTRH